MVASYHAIILQFNGGVMLSIMKNKYMARNFHPLVLFYILGIFLQIIGTLFFARSLWVLVTSGSAPLMSMFFMLSAGLQCIFVSMLFDMQDNRDLRK